MTQETVILKKELLEELQEPYQPPPYPKTDRELRVAKHIARLQSANEMLADGQISQVERDNIRTRMLTVIEDPNA